jgi:probable F420-dependent oxidoreductase
VPRVTSAPRDLGRIGVWTHQLDALPAAHAREVAGGLEALGYGTIWLPEAINRDAIVHSALLLDATSRIVCATGIVPLYARDAMTCNAAWKTMEEAFPGRFVLGIGVSHKPMVEGMRKTNYGPPVATMRQYLDDMDGAPYFAAPPTTPPRRVLAALGPKMLAVSAERADGAHPYHATPEHTRVARDILGPDKLLAAEQSVLLDADADTARVAARASLAVYMGLPNYLNNWKRLGFTDDDFANGGSDRFVDAIVAWGDEDAVKGRVQAHLDAGADHVCIQVISTSPGAPLEEWQRLADALL